VPLEMEIDDYDATPHECVHVLIIDEDGKGVDTGRLVPYQEHAGKLQRIAVCKDMRGRSLGRDIVETLEQQAKNSGFSHVVLDAQCSAEEFYLK
jgi:predicted GNAT family N-acyltransferase